MISPTYVNPVYLPYMADPFVLKHGGQYYAYGTGQVDSDARTFPILQSADLVHWEAKGGALIPPGGIEYWAPEVAYRDGTFYLYYSARGMGDPNHDHGLRVAASRSPLGPFEDAGRALVPDQPFSIDPHPFQDADGLWYLFYSRDFLTLEADHRVGTGIVVDCLIDMLTLAGDPQPVVRPHADWQIYQADRHMYGAVYDWHTVEGAAVRVHNGRYYCFYSGGAWEQANYGIAYVVADQPLGPYTRPIGVDLPIMRSVPDQVIGPGHNSFTTSPDGREEFVVYHAWDVARTARQMRIDRLRWEGDRPVIEGPTWTPQTIPD